METEKEGKALKTVENLFNTDRVMNFSDGVFAFAATLLVLKIDLPYLTQAEIASPRLISELINLWPSYFANIISFLIIGYYWLTHHAIFSLLKKLDHFAIWLNIIFLISLSFLPFPVDLFGDYGNSEVIIAFYCLSLSIAGFLLASIWIYASYKNRLIDEYLSKRKISYYTLRFLLAPAVFTISIPLIFIDPMFAKISWVFVVVGILLINRAFNLKKAGVIDKELI